MPLAKACAVRHHGALLHPPEPLVRALPAVAIVLPAWRYLFLLPLALLSLLGCERPAPTPLDNQVYIWQRQWLPAHQHALAASRNDFSTLRVLAAQAHPKEGWISARIDPTMLRNDSRPLIAVVRLDGQLPTLDSVVINQHVQQLVSDWQAAGLNVQGVEIDHDCASSRLSAYREFLQQLRDKLPAGMALSITALPAWINSPALPDLLQVVDSSVLQVHAVSRPEAGLFSPKQALQWAEAYAEQTAKPFYLALPAYGVALLDNPDGGAPWVESEVSLPMGGARHELIADPDQVAALLTELKASPPEHLQGLLWFRLPLPADRRAWPLATLQAVVHGQPLRSDIQLTIHQQGALSELSLINHGNRSAALPKQLSIAASACEAGDAIGGYRLQQPLDNPVIFTRQTATQLAAGHSLAIGWLRCGQLDQGRSHVAP